MYWTGRSVLIAVLSMMLAVASAAVVNDNKKTIIDSTRLGGDERYLIYTSTDKPVYRAEETVYLRATVLDAADNTPLDGGAAQVTVEIKGPRGNILHDGHSFGDDSVAGYTWLVPADTPGGVYTARVSSPQLGVPVTERSFEVRAYRTPRLKTQIEFVRDAYGPGEQVNASVSIERAEGGIPLSATATVIARVDGEVVYERKGISVSDTGIASTQFQLPESIEIGDGSLAFVIEDGGTVETASKSIPIILQTLDIQFYPEGGDLVAGKSNRVYLQAFRPDGKPADVSGAIVDVTTNTESGKRVVDVSTSHEGRGVFSFTPVAGHEYQLMLNKPLGLKRPFSLPDVKTKGVVLRALQNVYAAADDINVELTSVGDTRATLLTVYKRERLVDSIEVDDSATQFKLDPKDAEGVLIVTAWDAKGRPLAERLVYRAPKFAVKIKLKPNAESFVPGGRVSIDVLTVDENDKPIEAVVGLTVSDDAVLEMIDQREQAPRLPVMVYLENEVDDLADAHVYLDPQNSEAPKALDLLLGTQGWRRFVLIDFDRVKEEYPDAARRVLAERLAPPLPREAMMRRVMKAVADDGVRADVEVLEEIAPLAIGKEEPDDRVGNEVEPPEPQRVEAEAPQLDQDWMAGRMMADRFMERKRQVVIREYAHQVRPNRKANDRVDFTETLYWHKGLKTDARTGRATISFGLSDSVTSFRVMADAFARNGSLGSNDTIIKSVEPFYLEAKMPLEVTAGDIVELPITMVNASEEKLQGARLLIRGEGLDISQVDPIDLDTGARIRQVVRMKALAPGDYKVSFSAAAGPYTDTVTRVLSVKAAGFPVQISHGGLLGPDAEFSTSFTIPDKIDLSSIRSTIKVYPSPLANMEEALSALLREPNGCFEQTSSSNYPLVMAQQYFMNHQGIEPDKIAQARSLLDRGYKKLIGFESKGDGYEWFGANPAHEALTAYGLMEFVDMAKVMPVDEEMIKRTRRWLLDRRDGDGGFKRNQRALDSFGGAPAPTTNAYIVWSLLESGETAASLQKEIAAVKASALESDDSYVVALAANILYLANDKSGARALAKKLVNAVNPNGSVGGAVTTITRSGGDALAIETSSLTLLAWLRDDARWAKHIEETMKWLFERSKSGRFGSTQSTILALKAINTYDQARAKPKRAGEVQLLVDGKSVGKPVKFNKDSKGAINLPEIAARLRSGTHTVELMMDNGSEMPFAFELAYKTRQPLSSDEATLSLSTVLSSKQVREGELLEMMVTVGASSELAPTPIAIIGIPAGLEVRHDQLKELVATDRISAYEVNGRELILYWRALSPEQQVELPISLTAAVPGNYTAPASRAYLYYTDEHKNWVAGTSLAIFARGD